MAKTTGKIKAGIRMLYMDGVLVGCSTANGLSITNEQIADSCKDGSAVPPTTYEVGAQDWNFTADVTARFDDPNQYSALAAAAVAQTTHTWAFATVDTSDESIHDDDPYWQGEGFISSFQETANAGEFMVVSVTITPTGSLYLFNT